jgi:hypothetical protein
MQIRIATPGSPDWSKALQLARAKYKRSYEAQIDPNPDHFIVCFSDDPQEQARAIACAGVTSAGSRKLFSEAYIDEPAEKLVQRSEGRAVTRNDIVEVGSLASESFRAGTELVRILPILCWCLGRKYVLCTTTAHLRQMFHDAGMQFKSLQDASRERLDTTQQDRWGSYYEQSPVTGYFCLKQLTHVFATNTGRYTFSDLVINLQDTLSQPQVEEDSHALA